MKNLALALLMFGLPGLTYAGSICSYTDSSFVHEVCYDKQRMTLTLQLKSTYYTYCNVPESIYERLLSASSKGKYYNSVIKGHYAC